MNARGAYVFPCSTEVEWERTPFALRRVAIVVPKDATDALSTSHVAIGSTAIGKDFVNGVVYP